MQNQLICKKITSMLSLYINNNVSMQEKIFIENHLKTCESCQKKYAYLKAIIKNLHNSYKNMLELSRKKQRQELFNIKEHEKFLANISPYIDNELDANETYEFRKYLIKTKNAQTELKTAYTIQKNIRNVYKNRMNNTNAQIAKNIIKKLKNDLPILPESVILDFLIKSKFALIAIIASLLLCLGYIFYNATFVIIPENYPNYTSNSSDHFSSIESSIPSKNLDGFDKTIPVE